MSAPWTVEGCLILAGRRGGTSEMKIVPVKNN